MGVPKGTTALVVAAFIGRAAPADEVRTIGTDLYQTVPTQKTRAQLSDSLVAPATKAVKANDFAHAIPLYQALVVARGPGSPEAKELAALWAAAGQNEDAAAAWTSFAAAIDDPAARDRATAEAKRLAATPDSDKLSLADLVADARRLFTLGRAAFAAKQYGDALVYYHMATRSRPTSRASCASSGRPTTSSAPPIASTSSTAGISCSVRSAPMPTSFEPSSARIRRPCSARCSCRRPCRAPSCG